ncbi:MAG: sulfatase [Pigmentiphaga sp.]|nr:sulfatase [Pigmentiphaga sp.]
MKTLKLIKNIGIGAVALSPILQASAQKENKQPNVVFILADDLGWSDLECYGSNFYETPNINKLAKQGVMFTDSYAACHVSSPTRGSILTGQYPARTNLTDWLPGRKDFPFQELKNVYSAQQLPYGKNNTFVSVLKDNGYKTAIIGKWHLGEDSLTCENQGFEYHKPYRYLKGWPARSYFSPYNMPGLEDGPEDEYLTDRMTDEAIGYITENKDKPFFLYLSHYAVHDPIEGRPDLVKKYEEKLKKMPKPEGKPFILEGNPDDRNPLTREELDCMIDTKKYEGFKILPNRTVKIKQFQDNVQFAAMVESLDESVGRIMQTLKDLGIEDNTIVIFASDNGGMSAANFGNPGRIVPKDRLDKSFASSNLPLRGAKGFMYEGGIRVPTIIKWPNQGKSNLVTDIPVISVDYYPTILEMVGINTNNLNHIMDGKSLLPILSKKSRNTDNDFKTRPLYWHFPHYSNHGMQSPGGAIRQGRYKLLEYFENGIVQLFDLEADPSEQVDLSRIKPKVADELRTMLHQWRKSVNAQMMLPNPDYIPMK